MIHAAVTVVIATCFYFIGPHAEAAFVIAAFYCGREHAQAEYRAIKSLYGGKRANAPWWCGFEPRAWNAKSLLDWLGPLGVAVAASFI